MADIDCSSAVGTDRSGRDLLAALFRANADGIYGFVLARCGTIALAEELTAQTFEHAARAAASGDSHALTPSWLRTVARRRLIDHWRTEARAARKIETLRTELSTAGSADTGASDTAGSDEAVRAALDSLSMRQRAVLSLRYLDELSVSEVAEALDMTYRATESLLARSRRAFKIAFEEHR